MPRPAHHAALASYNGKIYVIGGFVPPENTQIPTGGAWQPIDDVWEYDPAADSWKALAPLPTQTRGRGGRGSRRQDLRHRRRHDGGRVQGPVLHVLWDLAQVLSTNDVYDPATNKWESRKPMAVPRNHAFAAAVNGKIYVIGGRTGHGFILSATNTDVVEEYDPASDMWSAPKERMPTARSGGGWGTDGRRIYVRRRRGDDQRARRRVPSRRGVRAGDQFLDRRCPPMPMPRHGVAGAVIGNQLSPGERDDPVRRRDGDARPEARSPHGVSTTSWS